MRTMTLLWSFVRSSYGPLPVHAIKKIHRMESSNYNRLQSLIVKDWWKSKILKLKDAYNNIAKQCQSTLDHLITIKDCKKLIKIKYFKAKRCMDFDQRSWSSMLKDETHSHYNLRDETLQTWSVSNETQTKKSSEIKKLF